MASRKSTVSGGARATIDHDEIRRWVEEHGGQPTRVAGTGGGKGSGVLRIDFPGFSGEGKLKPIPWQEFFERFEEANLAFLYQDRTKSGRASRFNKLVGRETVEPGTSEKKAPPRRARASQAGSAEVDRQSESESGGTRGRRSVKRAPSAPTARAARTARKTRKKTSAPRKSSKKAGRARSPGKKTRRSSSR